MAVQCEEPFVSPECSLRDVMAVLEQALGAEVKELKLMLGDQWRCDVFYDGVYTQSLRRSFSLVSAILEQVQAEAVGQCYSLHLTYHEENGEVGPAWYIGFDEATRGRNRWELGEIKQLLTKRQKDQ